MSDTYSHVKRLFYKGRHYRISELLKTGTFHTEFPGASPEMAKLAAVRSQLGEQPWPEELTDSGKEVVVAMEQALIQGYADYELERKKRIEKELKEARLKEEKKQKCITVYRETEVPESISVPLSRLVDESVAVALGEHFLFENGEFKIKKGQKPLEAFGAGFKNLNALHGQALVLKEGFANYEAKLALAAKEVLGNDWVIALSAAEKPDLIRVRKNMLAITRFRELGFDDTGVPIGTLRSLTEIRVHDNNAKNERLLKEGIQRFFDESKEKGSFVNQVEARKILLKVANKEKTGHQQIWDTFYHVRDESGKLRTFGSIGLEDSLFDKAEQVVDRKTGCVILRRDGEYVYDAIPPYVGMAAREAIKEQENVVAFVPEPTPQEDTEPNLDDLFNEEMDAL